MHLPKFFLSTLVFKLRRDMWECETVAFMNTVWKKKKKHCGDLWAVINPCAQCFHNSDMWCWNFASERCKRDAGWFLFPFIGISKRGWARRTKPALCLYIYLVFMKGFPLNSEKRYWCRLGFKAHRCVDIINYTMKVCMHYYLLPFTVVFLNCH